MKILSILPSSLSLFASFFLSMLLFLFFTTFLFLLLSLLSSLSFLLLLSFLIDVLITTGTCTVTFGISLHWGRSLLHKRISEVMKDPWDKFRRWEYFAFDNFSQFVF